MNSNKDRLEEAKSLLESNDSDKARVILLEVLKEEPNNQTVLMMLGGAYFYEKKFAEAEMVFERLVLAEPKLGQVSIALFNSLMAQGRHEEAVDEIRRFISAADPIVERETLEKYAEISKAIVEEAGGQAE